MNETASLWPLRLLAVGIAIVCWLLASYLPRLERSSDPPRTKTVSAAVTYSTPQGLMLLEARPTVELAVRGSRERIQSFNSGDAFVDVELRGVEPGKPTEVVLGPQHISLPEGLEVVSIVPERLTVSIDREETRVLPVQVKFIGEPAAGYQPQDNPLVEPSEVQVRGPLSHLAALSAVVAEVDIGGRAINDTYEVALPAPDSRVQIVGPSVVAVHVVMQTLNGGETVTGSL